MTNLSSLLHLTLASNSYSADGPGMADLQEALHQSDLAMQEAEKAVELNPAQEWYVESLARAKAVMSSYLLLLGRNQEALQAAKSAVDLIHSRPELHQPNHLTAQLLIPFDYGQVVAAIDPKGALPLLEVPLQKAQAARRIDPADMQLRDEEAEGLAFLGHIQLSAGERGGWRTLHKGISELEQIVRSKRDEGEVRFALALAYKHAAEELVRERRIADARTEFLHAQKVLAEERASTPEDLEAAESGAAVALELAVAETNAGRQADGCKSASEATNLADQVLRVHADNPVAQKIALSARSYSIHACPASFQMGE